MQSVVRRVADDRNFGLAVTVSSNLVNPFQRATHYAPQHTTPSANLEILAITHGL